MFPKCKCALGRWLLGNQRAYMEIDEITRSNEANIVGVRTFRLCL